MILNDLATGDRFEHAAVNRKRKPTYVVKGQRKINLRTGVPSILCFDERKNADVWKSSTLEVEKLNDDEAVDRDRNVPAH